MFQGVREWYQENGKKRWKISFLATFLIGLLIHLYKFTNVLPHFDSLGSLYSDQNIIASGRWLLQFACGISSYFDLPWVIGLISLVYLGLTAVIISELFEMENTAVMVISGGILVAFPAVTETFVFEYTADGYFLSMLLSTLAVYFGRKKKNRGRYFALSALLLCLSCGIYQSYICFALLLLLCLSVVDLLEGKQTAKAQFKSLLRWAGIFVVALGTYFVIWKLLLYVQGSSASDYAGIDKVGILTISTIKRGLIECIVLPGRILMGWNGYTQKLTLFSVLNVLWGLFLIGMLVAAAIRSSLYKRKKELGVAALCLLLCWPGAVMWGFTSELISHRPIMLLSIAVLYIFTAVLAERWGRQLWKNLCGLLLVITIFNNGLVANIVYFHMNLNMMHTYATATEWMQKIHKVDPQQKGTQIAIVGRGSQMSLTDTFTRDPIRVFYNIHEDLMLFSYGVEFLTEYLKMDYTPVDSMVQTELEARSDVQVMPIWPEEGSIQLINETVVIKRGEILND